MATLLDLDETLCKTPVCQHPQCWVTFRRLKLGHPRYRPLGSITRTPQMDPDGLPVLSVTTMPNNQNLPNKQNVQGEPSLVTFSRLPSSMYNLYNSATFSMDKILFPGMNSYSEITVASKSVASFLSTKKPGKVATVDPCLQDLKTNHPTMVWVPNSQQKFQQQEKREKPLKVQIKELTFTDVAGQLRRGNQDPDVSKIRKVNKTPTGGCPHNLILTRSPILRQTHSRKWMTASSVKENREEVNRSKRRSYEHHSYSESQHDPGPGSLSPENRRVVLYDSRSKHRSSPTISQSSPVYKLDEQNLDALDNLGIDLNRIRNQTYLWKKYIGLTGPSSRIQPPGSVDCYTERSHDLDSRDSPSSTGFSQTSWTELEPSDAPLDLEPRKKNEQDFPGEQTGKAESNQLQGVKNTPQEPPDFESEHLLRKGESPKENELPNNSEPISQDTEVTEGHGSSEQRIPSPQPYPPPPSPTQLGIN
ncbi:uncharacterized protein C9orf43 homolog isoform X2 [Rana temporaria]|uniref:uncharacterized protein C9orf43 homolog isoform X2 n=1 Tax=Rana temporaria TaxID=8407 RepID=UPI001AACED46|nr:uncharacterized protein C9orf43 homolog isoform X2 [Rana temporaria]